MKKEDITGLIVYALILVFSIIFGLTVLQTHSAESTFKGGMYVLFIIGAILVGLVLNAVIFELAHVVGAKIGGYEIESVTILGVCFTKENGKRVVKFSGFDGLSGETKIYPKDDLKDKKGNPKEASPYAYLWFGTLFVVIEIVIIMFAFSMMTSDKGTLLADIGYFLLTIGAIGLMILIYNILPFKLDAPTDGYKLTLVSNPKNKAAFNELLRVEKAMKEGKEIEIKTFTEITNFTADLNLNKVYQMLDKRDFEGAEPLLDMIINAKNDVSSNVYLRARSQKIYINLMNKSVEEAKEYIDKNVTPAEIREISSDVSMPSIRVYILIAGLIDKSKSEVKLTIDNVVKALKKTAKTRQKIEMALFNDTLQKVIDAHPKWELEGYKLAIKE